LARGINVICCAIELITVATVDDNFCPFSDELFCSFKPNDPPPVMMATLFSKRIVLSLI